MIVAVADDLTGAAEVAGIAAARGLRAEVQLQFDPRTQADVVAVDTQSRSLAEGEAVRVVQQVADRVAKASPSAIYKKTDSVLRGNVRAEIQTILQSTGQSRAVLIPANPRKQRLVRDGQYLIDGQPVHTTCFGRDPEHPRRSSSLRELLGETDSMPVQLCREPSERAADGITVPDIQSVEDLRAWADVWAVDTLAAGAAEFFEALLDRWRPSPSVMSPQPLEAGRRLFICGSLASWQLGVDHVARKQGVAVLPLGDVIARQAVLGTSEDARQPFSAWVQDAAGAIDDRGVVMMAIGEPEVDADIRPVDDPSAQPPVADRLTSPRGPSRLPPQSMTHRRLLTPLVEASSHVASRAQVDCLLIEGGETATAFVRQMRWNRFLMLPSTLPGVGVMRPLDTPYAPRLIIKPGSYPWPAEVWPARQSSRCP